MKAIVLKKPGDFAIEEVKTPEPGAGEVRIRIKMAGICMNDVRDFKGDCSWSYPRIGGHEYAGVVEKLGAGVDASAFPIGQRVVRYIIDACGYCDCCKRGLENICRNMPHSKIYQNPHGLSGFCGFAERVISKASELYRYPDETAFADMALTEPLACTVNSVERAGIRLGDDVLVIGGGTMGLLHIMLAQKKGARVFLSEPMKKRREKALGLGCHAAIDPVHEDLGARIRALTGKGGADVVFDTTALPDVAKAAVEAAAPGGKIVMFSSMHPNDPVPVDLGAVHSLQRDIIGAVNPTISSYDQAVLLIAKKIFSPAPVIEEVVPFSAFGKAMERAMRPDTYKILLDFSGAAG